MTFLSNIHVGKTPIRLSDILERVSEEDILAYYFNIYTLPTLISSPLRKDNNPSFSIYKTKGHIRCYDFGLKKGYGLFDLLMEYFHMSFSDLLIKMWTDMCHISVTQHNTPKIVRRITDKHIKLEVCTRNFRQHDLDFWQQFGINQHWLRFGRVFAISDIIYKQNGQSLTIPADKYAYAYVEFKDNIQSIKVYQPFNTRFKWMSDGNSSIWNLWSQLPPQGDRLIITSSVKDALCLWANLGIPSCCLQSESTIPKKQVVEQLKTRFKRVFVIYDNDYTKQENTGQINALKLVEQYGFTNICIDPVFCVKDPSDFFKRYGLKTFLQYFYLKLK